MGMYLVSTEFKKHEQRVVEMPGHYKRHNLNINADNNELAFAAQVQQRLTISNPRLQIRRRLVGNEASNHSQYQQVILRVTLNKVCLFTIFKGIFITNCTRRSLCGMNFGQEFDSPHLHQRRMAHKWLNQAICELLFAKIMQI